MKDVNMLLFIHIHICLSLHPLVNIFTNLGQYETDCDNVGKSAHQMNQMNDEDSHRITSVLTDADFCNFSDKRLRLLFCLFKKHKSHLTGQFERTGQSCGHFSSNSSNGSARQRREVAVMNSSRAQTQQVGSAPPRMHPGSCSFYGYASRTIFVIGLVLFIRS